MLTSNILQHFPKNTLKKESNKKKVNIIPTNIIRIFYFYITMFNSKIE